MVIIANLRNFTFAHNLLVLDDDDKVVANRQCAMGMVAENIIELCHEYECNKIKLWGNNKFLDRIEHDLKAMGMAKYNLNLDIEIIFE